MNLRELLKKPIEALKKIRKEDIKNFYCSIAFTNTLLIILIVFCYYSFYSVTNTERGFIKSQYLNINGYDYAQLEVLQEINKKVKDIKNDIEDKTDSKPKYYYY